MVRTHMLSDHVSSIGFHLRVLLLKRFPALNFRRLILGACWCLLHFLISIMNIWSQLFGIVFYLIPNGILKRHPVVRLEKLQSLAIVFDDEDVKDFPTIIKLLNWVSDFGIRNAILYDVKGVLKNYVSALRKLTNLDIVRTDARDLNLQDSEVMTPEPVNSREKLSIELLSWSDGKEAAAKAASLLYSKYSSNGYLVRDQGEPFFTEADFRDALKAMGFGVSEPELLLVFGPVRCHLGFPPWRARYTEIVHMGPLKSLKYDALIRVIHDFSTKSQNYGR